MNRALYGLLLGGLGVICFGGTLPMTRLAVSEVTPWFITFFRGTVAGVLAMITLLILKKEPPPRHEWGKYLIASSMITFGFPGLVALGMAQVPSAHGGVILGIIPLATALLSAVFFKERLSLWFWLLSLLGAGLVVIYALRQTGDFTFHQGDFILFAAVFAAATAYCYSGHLSKTRKGWEVVSWALLPAFPLMFMGFIWLYPTNFFELSFSTYMGLAYVALISQYFGFFPWNAGLAMGGVARVGQMMLLMPFITLLFAYFIVGEQIAAEMVIFLVAVMGVVVLAAKVR
jgi:drug/metabolite transporter (DMT)-like permease